MTRITTGRIAACGGALVLALGAGCIVAPAADAATGSGLVPTLQQVASGTTLSTPSSIVPVVATTVQNATGSALQGVVGSTGLAGSPSTAPAVSTTTSMPDVAGTTTPSVTTTTAPSGAVQQILDYLASTAGTGAVTGSGSGTGASSGGVTLAVGEDGKGGSIVSVNLGGQRSATVDGKGSAGANGAAGASSSSSSSASGSSDASTSGTSGLIGLQIRRSLATVYPVKDGYRDQIAFTLDGLTADGQPQGLAGLAVLKRGGVVVKRWSLSRSDQVLQWNGRSGGKVTPGDYRLLVGVQDLAGRGFGAATEAKVSPKRLVASTQRLTAQSISGTHTMAAAPRKGLSRGVVTMRITTVATKVKGHAQKLIFKQGGKRLVVRIKKGTHTSRPLAIPASFTRYRIAHTWKKGQVHLKSIRYTYSYQSLK